MNNPDQNTEGPISFYDRYSSLSDNQIKEILRNHKNYQEAAVNAAVKIAIERGLIHTEQDLLAPEYQTIPKVGLSFFPEITNLYHYKKVVASIYRVLFFLSLLPIVFGIMKYAEGQIFMTVYGVGSGVIWLALSFLLYKTKRPIIANLQIILLVFVLFVVGYQLLIQDIVRVADLIILVCGILLAIYFLMYMKRLINTKPI